MANSMTFGKKLKMLRVGKGLTQDEMASELGISRRAYIPYEQDKTKPRNEATYRKMAEILDCDIHELMDLAGDPSPKNDTSNTKTTALLTALGFISAVALPFPGINVAVSAATLAAASTALIDKGKESEKALPSNSACENNNDMRRQYENRQNDFQVKARDILFNEFLQDRILRKGNLDDLEDRGEKPDYYYTVFNSDIQTWWFSFWAKDPELDEQLKISPDERARVMISKYATAAFDPHRKISIVVDDKELFDNLIAYRNHNCFHGNMTAILVDVENVMIVKEEAIAELDTPSALEKAEITTES